MPPIRKLNKKASISTFAFSSLAALAITSVVLVVLLLKRTCAQNAPWPNLRRNTMRAHALVHERAWQVLMARMLLRCRNA